MDDRWLTVAVVGTAICSEKSMKEKNGFGSSRGGVGIGSVDSTFVMYVMIFSQLPVIFGSYFLFPTYSFSFAVGNMCLQVGWQSLDTTRLHPESARSVCSTPPKAKSGLFPSHTCQFESLTPQTLN